MEICPFFSVPLHALPRAFIQQFLVLNIDGHRCVVLWYCQYARNLNFRSLS